MITGLLSLLGLIPGLENLASSWLAARYNAQVALITAKVGGDVAVAQSIVTAQAVAEQSRVTGLAVIAGNSLLTFLVIAFAGPLVIYMWKVVGYDIIWGSINGCHKGITLAKCAIFDTDPIKGQVADWASTIIWAIFGSTAAVGAIGAAERIIKRNA